MTRPITIAALQPTLATVGAQDDPAAVRAATLRTGAALIAEAGRRGATVACLPECFPTIALSGAAATRLADGADLPAVQDLGAVAARYGMTLVVGVHRRGPDGRLYNTAAVVEQGRVVGLYDKVHPTFAELEPPLQVTPGSVFPVFRLSWGAAGVLICHDNSFVESARCLALNGAEVLFWPHVQSGWGDAAWEAVLRVRAIDNGVWIVSSCFSVAEGRAWRPGMMLGRSSIVAPDGTILADAGHHPGLALATIDLDQPRVVDDFSRAGQYPFRTGIFGERRPDAYSPLTRPLAAVLERQESEAELLAPAR